MNYRFLYIVTLFLLMSCMACESTDNNAAATGSEASATTTAPKTPASAPLPESHNCKPKGEVMDDNQIWLRTTQTLLAIEADSTTSDPTFGESHRILRAYNTANCNEVFSETLPVNVSPDFPYYLASINYNRNSQLVAIQGAKEIYCYDVAGRNLLPKLQPQFKKTPAEADAQSGMIQNLELYENYLIGYAADHGFFAFDLRQKENVKALLSSADFKSAAGQNALFFIESNEGEFQGLICNYDNEAEFKINTLLEKPANISTQIPDNVANNRYIVISEKEQAQNKLIAIDMQKGVRVPLPDDIANKQTKTVLQWLRRQ